MKDITVRPDITIHQAMKVLNKTAEKCLLIVDENKRLLGTLTDGDIRRSILTGTELSADISSSYITEPTILTQGKYSKEEAKQLLSDLKLDLVPVVDENHLVVDYVTWSDNGILSQPKNSLAGVPVVIMAGGKGTRLKPFTKVLPKPLIPIKEKPIIEHIIEHFTKLGCTEFHLTVNYKAGILKAYFDELQTDYKVSFIEEQKPLGTAGSLRFLSGQFNQPFFVTNCDMIIKADCVGLYEFHKKGGFGITLVASAKEYIIPYGTCELNGDGHLSNINEKPKYNFLINTGLYVLSPEVLELIPENECYHITQLIKDVRLEGKKTAVFPIAENEWFDVGEWKEYNKVKNIL